MSEAATSVERAFAILETFERERRPLLLKELSELCDIPTSTCHSLVHTLLKRAYLYQTGRRKELYPTRKLYDMGATILAHDQIIQRLLPLMEELREITRETVILGKRQRDHILYLEVLEGPEVIRYSARPGDTKPLHSSCIGKSMLSLLSPGEAQVLLEGLSLDRVTPNTITGVDRLLRDLDQGRTRGFFATHGENVSDVTALAVPIALNNEQFGLAVAGPSHRVDARFEEISEHLKAVQEQVRENAASA